MNESANPLLLGGTETIAIAGVMDFSGILTVLIEFESNNHIMQNLGDGTWRHNIWTPNNVGNESYTIYIKDNAGNWNTISGTINVIKTTIVSTPIPSFMLPLIILVSSIGIVFILFKRRTEF